MLHPGAQGSVASRASWVGRQAVWERASSGLLPPSSRNTDQNPRREAQPEATVTPEGSQKDAHSASGQTTSLS